MSTPYHARYIAHELTRRRPAASSDRLSMSLFDAAVDLNPHQIDAAMFALESPLRQGVVLADEVGLGKTIEAGLVLCQYWAEHRRRLLVICPASLRKQWSLELQEKFNLPTVILDGASYRQAQRAGNPDPLSADAVVITSINFASAMQAEVRAIQWDLVVIDEAHKLRNSYRSSNKMGQRIRWALEDRQKLLLTATPLQNSLLELFGLSTIIDEHLFGDVTAFRALYMRQDSDISELRTRLQHFLKRTLRNQVLEYIRYTERRPITQPFHPSDEEHQLYESISEFLLRPNTYAIPQRQRQLTVLILRKLLASSSSAIAGTFATIRDRLIRMRDNVGANEYEADADFIARLVEEAEMEEEIVDETIGVDGEEAEPESPPTAEIDRAKLDGEIAELGHFVNWANSIGVDTKSRALIDALKIGFGEMERMGAARKAIIFTESRRTQEYLRRFLEANGYAGKLVLFNGSNGDAEARRIYDQWVKTNAGTGRASGSRAVDGRTALIEYFRDEAEVMIATEAAAEGVNLQFCSLVINYDLPWNPQRIEQRIGRCHRYGQQHDVVVLNFLNERNYADQRVLELLAQKFNLFSGVFGASDEVLGVIESGVDFEKRILDIYQECRTQDEIETAFQKLRDEMDESIRTRLDDTRKKLMERFDEDVHSRLRMQLDNAREQLDLVSRLFWMLTRYMLRQHATFDDDALTFELDSPVEVEVPRGRYHLISKTAPNIEGDFLYRLSHPLGEYVIDAGKRATTPVAEVRFDISNHPTRIAAVEDVRGRAGWLALQKLTVQSFEPEEYLLFSAFDDDGKALDQETCEKLFRVGGMVVAAGDAPADAETKLKGDAKRHAAATIARSLEANNKLFLQERERLERWAEDKVVGAEKELADTKAQIKVLTRQSRLATSTEEQHAQQLKIAELEKQKRRQRQRIFEVEDEIVTQRDKLIEALERRLTQRTETEQLFSIRWSVV